MCWYQVEDGIYNDCVILGHFCFVLLGGGGLALILLVLLGHQETQIVLKFSAIPLAPRVEKPIQTQLDNSINVMLVEQSGRNTEILKSVLSSDQNRS